MAETVTISLTQGGLRGRQLTTKDGVTYYSFQGIPYAKPPVGPLRFKPPEPADPWDGTRDALIEGAIAPQIDNLLGDGYAGEEDCLFLNVYTTKLPKASEDASKPVMVWIHGGGLFMGSSNTVLYGPDYLMAADVVLVTLNYRLGPLGFLSTGDSEVPGNMGFMDQVMALRWVQLNIAHFGGDPGNVTIFGESAGGCSVHHLVLSPMAKNLFHRAVAQSGSAINPWSYREPEEARRRAFRVGETLGCKTDSSKELVEFLRNLPVRDLVEGVDKTLTEDEKHPLPLFFSPTKEEDSEYSEKFLPDSPMNIITEGKFNQVPFIIGFTTDEGLFVLKDAKQNPEWFESLNEKLHTLMATVLHVDDTEKAKEIANKVKTFYFGDKRICQDTFKEYAEVLADIWFLSGIHTSIKKQVLSSESPIYVYRFAYDGKLAFSNSFIGEGRLPGVSHADDIGYLFHMAHHENVSLDPDDEALKVRDRVVKLWTNFAKTGDPTPEDDSLLEVVWCPVSKSEINCLNIDKELSLLKGGFDEKRVAFWEEIFASLQ